MFGFYRDYKINMNVPQLLTLLTILVSSAFAIEGDSLENVTLDMLESRGKRQVNALPLVYPYGAIFKFIIGLSVPIRITDGISVGFGANIQFQYAEFTNSSELSRYYYIKTVSREQRDLELDWDHRADERLIFYKSVSSLLETKGMNGNDCMLRAICEAAQYPVEEEGLVGEIFHILLTPDYGRSPFEKDLDWDEPMGVYKDAAVAGRHMFSCPAVYSGCPEGEGFFELITKLGDE